ncbi:MAG: glucose-6-phosphate dehydrogenase [Candidatus Paceibacterota bacterium]|jgi:glucose-6-phosphate 1-dehydrogenase
MVNFHDFKETVNTSALHPTIFVIFGITGDLAARKLLPALLALFTKKLLPPRFAIIGFSRRYFTREEFRELIRSRLNIKPGQFKEEDIKHFMDHMSYEQGNFDSKPAYTRLKERLTNIDNNWGQCSNKLFHLSVPPNLYEGILTNLASSGLAEVCDDMTGWTRILIEKPFGNDIVTARSLDRLLGKLFKEEQIFRIDHYLAKEALQNIIAFRFANPMFEPMWNNKYIEKVHIKLYEKSGTEGRATYYDPIGALRDVGQNHMLQMLSLIAMNEPRSLIAKDIRKERIIVLKALKKFSKRELPEAVIRGQYKGYLLEQGVSAQSRTETYFRIQALIGLSRWKDVPFYLESGKALYESKTEIDVYFRPAKHSSEIQNILTFRIQPDEGIKIKFFVKTPGKDFAIEAKTLKFKYSDVPSFSIIQNDYERLLHDAFIGDQTLFTSTEEIMTSWEFVTPILQNWSDLPLRQYEKGAREIE